MPLYATAKGTLVRETTKALLIEVRMGRVPRVVWLPRSQMMRMTRIGDQVEVSIPKWLARKHKLL